MKNEGLFSRIFFKASSRGVILALILCFLFVTDARADDAHSLVYLVNEDASLSGNGSESISQLAVDLPSNLRKELVRNGVSVVIDPDKTYNLKVRLSVEVDYKYALVNAWVLFKKATLTLEHNHKVIASLDFNSDMRGGNFKSYGEEGVNYAKVAAAELARMLLESREVQIFARQQDQKPTVADARGKTRKNQNQEERSDAYTNNASFVSDVDINIPSGVPASKYDVAVVIGNRNYQAGAGIPDVEYADRDARTMREYLIKSFGYFPENIIYVEDATTGKFNEIFGSENDYRGRLFRFVKKDVSRVFIYYVGHGAPDLKSQEAYFVPVDANPQYLSSNGYRLSTFYANLSKIPAKNMTIVLDSCFSGNSPNGMLFKNISPALVKVKSGAPGLSKALTFNSAAVDQVSTWYPEKRHSLFTYFFLKGIQGEADTNRDHSISAGEMREYLNENVPYVAGRLSGVEQQPSVEGNPGEILYKTR